MEDETNSTLVGYLTCEFVDTALRLSIAEALQTNLFVTKFAFLNNELHIVVDVSLNLPLN